MAESSYWPRLLQSAPPPTTMPTSLCELRAVVFAYLKLMSAYLVEADLAELKSQLLTRSFSAGTLMVVGAAFVLGPVLLGKDWIMRTLYLSAALVGAVFTSISLSGWAQGYAGLVVSMAKLDEEGACAFALINVVLGALVTASAATKVVGLAIFGVGAFAVGSFSYSAIPAYVVPFVSQQFPDVVLQQWHTYAAVALLALAGGYVFTGLAFAVVDFLLGAIGAYLVSDGTIELALANNLVPPDLLASMQLEANLKYYVLALAGLIFFVRVKLVERPRSGRSEYSELIGR